MSESKKRPTKKQYELLLFIDEFIKEHGYSPSYREIMRGCNYTSVATVALHVGNLVKRGHIVKKDNSARSLEVVKSDETAQNIVQKEVDHAKKLVEEIEKRLKQFEQEASQEVLDEVYVLVGALKVLGHDNHAYEFATELHKLK